MTSSAVDLIHVPTKTTVHSESERSLQDNKRIALLTLRARLWNDIQEKEKASRNGARKDMIGMGERGSKNWTVRFQDDHVTYHPTGKKIRLKDYLNGDYDLK